MGRGGSLGVVHAVRLVQWVRRYWGYALGMVLLLTWGSIQPGTTALLWLATAGYFAFRAPAFCAAETRQSTLCRNNASGLLMGCHLREHKWQKLRLAVAPRKWRQLGGWLRRQAPVPLIGAAATCVAALAAAVQAAVAVAEWGFPS